MLKRFIIGIDSGCTGERVDAALLEIDGLALDARVQLVHAFHQVYPKELKDFLRQSLLHPSADIKQIGLLHRVLGETFAAAARQMVDGSKVSVQQILCIGCPGIVLSHEPDGRFPSNLTVGMPAVVAERTGITTVADFASRDLAASGQGIPITAMAEYLLFRDPKEMRILIDLGGTAHLTSIPAGARVQQVIGYDLGVCNALLNQLIRQLTNGRESHDPGGKYAVQGRCVDALLQRWLAHPYWQRRPPKCMPRHRLEEELTAQALQMAHDRQAGVHDLLCTATHLIARIISQSVRKLAPTNATPTSVLLSGGGLRNGFLLHLLTQQLDGYALHKTDVLGIPGDAHGAIANGILAALFLDGVPASVPSATGAAGARLIGSLTPGTTANWSRCLSWMAAQIEPPPDNED